MDVLDASWREFNLPLPDDLLTIQCLATGSNVTLGMRARLHFQQQHAVGYFNAITTLDIPACAAASNLTRHASRVATLTPWA